MQCVSDTTEEEFAAYIEKARSCGYIVVNENCTDEMYSFTLEKSKDMLHAYFSPLTKEARVIVDKTSSTLRTFGYTYNKAVKDTTTIYQYGLFYNKYVLDSEIIAKCGMLYIIKLADNSLFMIDSGMPNQATDTALRGLMDFLREITGTPAGEKVRVAGWFFTHAHLDHLGLANQFLQKYHSDITLERVIANFPNITVIEAHTAAPAHTFLADSCYDTFYKLLEEYCPDVKYLQIHTGMKFRLADITIEAIHTHEDLVSALTGLLLVKSSYNDTSTVLKIAIAEGRYFIVLGDANTRIQSRLMEMYTRATLACDIVQIAHHGYNNLADLYKTLGAQIGLLSNSPNILNPEIMLDQSYPRYESRVNWHTASLNAAKYIGKLYFAADGTYGFTYKDGGYAVICRELIK